MEMSGGLSQFTRSQTDIEVSKDYVAKVNVSSSELSKQCIRFKAPKFGNKILAPNDTKSAVDIHRPITYASATIGNGRRTNSWAPPGSRRRMGMIAASRSLWERESMEIFLNNANVNRVRRIAVFLATLNTLPQACQIRHAYIRQLINLHQSKRQSCESDI
ncbi:hypothetical protein CBL_05648 [Carabus blaptoides fortunei]